MNIDGTIFLSTYVGLQVFYGGHSEWQQWFIFIVKAKLLFKNTLYMWFTVHLLCAQVCIKEVWAGLMRLSWVWDPWHHQAAFLSKRHKPKRFFISAHSPNRFLVSPKTAPSPPQNQTPHEQTGPPPSVSLQRHVSNTCSKSFSFSLQRSHWVVVLPNFVILQLVSDDPARALDRSRLLSGIVVNEFMSNLFDFLYHHRGRVFCATPSNQHSSFLFWIILTNLSWGPCPKGPASNHDAGGGLFEARCWNGM